MKKIMIDLDETICSPSYLKEVNKYLNTNYKYEDIKTYFVEDIIAEDKKQDFLDYFGLADISDLPKLNDEIEINEEEQNLFESKYKEIKDWINKNDML